MQYFWLNSEMKSHWNMIYVCRLICALCTKDSDWQEHMKTMANKMKRYAAWHVVAWYAFIIAGFVFLKTKFARKFTCENYFMCSAFNVVSVFMLMFYVHSVRSIHCCFIFGLILSNEPIHACSIVNYLLWILCDEARATVLQIIIIIEEDAPKPHAWFLL